MPANLKMQQWPQDWSVFIQIPNKSKAEKCSNYHTIVLISHASKVILKILGFNSMRTVNFQMLKMDFKKAEEPEIKLPTFIGYGQSMGFSQKHLLLLH